MHGLDWVIIAVYLVYVLVDGVRRAKGTREIEGYFLANRNLPWWAVGLSVMATQASAITFLSTPGQAYADGMRFVQFYFGLPLAMIVICATAIPIYRRLNVFTAYEYLERRFDGKTWEAAQRITAVPSDVFLIKMARDRNGAPRSARGSREAGAGSNRVRRTRARSPASVNACALPRRCIGTFSRTIVRRGRSKSGSTASSSRCRCRRDWTASAAVTH